MKADNLNKLKASVKALKPLIHCITNPISINQCANAILAVGARPIMAEHPEEVAEITKTAQALMLNLGNITDARMKSIMISAELAKKERIPCVLDVVGIACSELRRKFAIKVIEETCPTVIKGNYSEINALKNHEYKSSGVDADGALDIASVSKAAVALALKYNAIILASGKVDIITDGKQVIYAKNGTPQLASVTGTGCMLGALCACFMSVSRDITAAAAACSMLGICGELSETEKGSGSFMARLMDNMSALTEEAFEKYPDLEEKEIEKI